MDIVLAYSYAMLTAIIVASLYGIVVRPNLLKKIMCLTILGDTANTFIIFLGFRRYVTPQPPILLTLRPTKEQITYFVTHAVDPLPQCLVLTAIVINMAVTLFLVFLTIQLYRHYGTLDVRKFPRLRG